MKTEGRLRASVVICTYNRAQDLRAALASLQQVTFPGEAFEVVVVDNASNDATPQVVAEARAALPQLRYVFEPRLSWAVAHEAGARTARGEYILYIDDDVTVTPGWLAAVVAAFDDQPQTGLVGGPIEPVYAVTPPDWLIHCPGLFNGLSLLDEGTQPHFMGGVPGPNLAVRRSALQAVGGFPPDIVGVDALGKPGTIERLFVGNGDYGLARKMRRAGYRVAYAPDARVYHHIPPVRLTPAWWRSRLAGEAYMDAFVDWQEHSRAWPVIGLRLAGWAGVRTAKTVYKVLRNLWQRKHWRPLLEVQWAYVQARVKIQWALLRHPDLGDALWQVALTGIPPQDMDRIMSRLP